MNKKPDFLELEKTGVSAHIYLDALTGLRGFAAIWVALWHTWRFSGRPVYEWEIAGYLVDLTPFVRTGWAGVDIFFVLSGFVLALPWCQARLGHRSVICWPEYFRRRLLRVLPAYYVQLLLLICVAWFLSGTFPLSSADILAYLTMLHNIIPLDSHLINNVYWTLPVEFDFYLVLPLLSLLLLPRRWILLLSGGIILAVLYRYTVFWSYMADKATPDKVVVLNQLPGRLDQFVSGMAAAYLYVKVSRAGQHHSFLFRSRNWLFVLSLTGFVGLGYLIHYAQPMGVGAILHETHWGGYWTQFYWHTLSGLVLGMMIFSIALGIKGMNAVLANRGMLYLGVISYSLYLWHYPVLQWAKALSLPSLVSGWPLLNLLVWVVPPILLLSSLSYWLVERPFLRMRHRVVSKS